MKPNKPIKRTPLKRSTKKIAKRSQKTEEIYVERRKIVARMLSDFPLCFACPVFAKNDGLHVFIHRNSVDVHELVRRSQGGSILDESNLLAVCRKCHDRIGRYPQLAFELGLSRHHWEDRQGD